jgi:Fur family ferric uptake transcriptional regulator
MKKTSPSEELRETGLKVTAPRLKILEFFNKNPNRHFSADDIYLEVIKEKLDIGIATIYRVLMQFEGAGILRKNNFESAKGEGKAIFELNEGTHHDHIVCIKCGKIEEFFDATIEKRQKEIADRLGFTLVDHSLSMYGSCKACKKK